MDSSSATPNAPEPDGDPGHLMTADEWADVVEQVEQSAGVHTFAARTLTSGITVLNRPAKYHGGAQTPTLQVIHDAETPISDDYARVIGDFFAAGPKAGTSAHRMVGPRTVVKMLGLGTVGYHCGPNGNGSSAGYEQCGYSSYTAAQWSTPAALDQQDTLAQILAEDGLAWGIPDRHLSDAQLRAWAAAGRSRALGGRATHDQVARVLGGTTHTDPAPNYPLDQLNAKVTRARAAITNPTPEDDGTMAFDDDDSKHLSHIDAVESANLDAIRRAVQDNASRTADLLRQVTGLRADIAGLPAAIAAAFANPAAAQ